MFIPLNDDELTASDSSKGLILIFTEGTIIGPKNIWNFFRFKAYIPLGSGNVKITKWKNEGWDIAYVTSRRAKKEINEIKSILMNNAFPGSRLYYRGKGESYQEIVEGLVPDILVEDDCRSIGGKGQMIITHVKKGIKEKIKSVIVNEFTGIDSLPDSFSELFEYRNN